MRNHTQLKKFSVRLLISMTTLTVLAQMKGVERAKAPFVQAPSETGASHTMGHPAEGDSNPTGVLVTRPD